MGWLPRTWNEEPHRIPEGRRFSPGSREYNERRARREADERIAAMEKAHHEEQERLKQEQWERDAPKRKAQEQQRWLEKAIQRQMEHRRQWQAEQDRLQHEAEEKRKRARECYNNLRDKLIEFLDTKEFVFYFRDVVQDAWNDAVARSEREKFPEQVELFDEVRAAVDTDLLSDRDVMSAVQEALDDNREKYNMRFT